MTKMRRDRVIDKKGYVRKVKIVDVKIKRRKKDGSMWLIQKTKYLNGRRGPTFTVLLGVKQRVAAVKAAKVEKRKRRTL